MTKKGRNLRIAIAQISTSPGNIVDNKKKIIKYIIRAKRESADIIIFPELAVPGYMSLDLMLHQNFIKENLKAIENIKKHTKNILAILGFIDQNKKEIGPDGTPLRYNSAAILYNGKKIDVLDKTLLPNYDVFFENRFFVSGRGRKLVTHKKIKIGIQICEDLWDENYPVKVSQELIKQGADILINISGSPFYVGKIFDRENLIKKISTKNSIPFIYVNTVGVQDGYDGELIFDGQSMIFDCDGNLIYIGKRFEEELFYTNTDQLFNINKTKSAAQKGFNLPVYNANEELLHALTLAIKDYFVRTHYSKAFIGLSGGIDSAVTAVLAVRALGQENITGIYMPSAFSAKESVRDAKLLAKNLGISFKVISIEGIYKNMLKIFKKEFNNLPFDTTEENLQARIRGMILMAHANKLKGLVISTGNKTEMALGYTTLYGDMCGALAPLADVSKLEVYELAKVINSSDKILIPENSIKRIPTAELRQNQTDEYSLGASYQIISPLVSEIIEDMKPTGLLLKKYPKELVKSITELVNQNEYKRRQSAPSVKVTKKTFGIGRRIPIAHKFKN